MSLQRLRALMCDLGSALAQLERAATLPVDGALFDLLRRIDPDHPDEAVQVRLAQQWARVEAAAGGWKMSAVGGVVTSDRDADEFLDFRDNELAVALRLGMNSTRTVMGLAQTLATHGRGVLAAMRAGWLAYGHARQYGEALADLTPEQSRRVEELTLDKASALTPGELRRVLRRAVVRVGADDFAKRHEQAKKDVYFSTFFDDADGMATLSGRMAAIDAKIIESASEAWARAAKAAGDTRPLRELRAAGLVDMSERYLMAPDAPRAHGRPITVNVTADLPTFLGLTNHAGEILGTDAMIPAQAIRDLLPDAQLRRLITDPMTGELLDYGRTTYRFPNDLAAYEIFKWVTSTGPGSTVPADRGDIDHGKPWDDGGETDRANGNPVNRQWHRAKTLGGWTVIQTEHGWTWRSPHGLTSTTTPHDYRLGP